MSTADGKEIADAIGAQEYFEVSAKTGHNMKNLFDYAAEIATDPKLQTTDSSCSVL